MTLISNQISSNACKMVMVTLKAAQCKILKVTILKTILKTILMAISMATISHDNIVPVESNGHAGERESDIMMAAITLKTIFCSHGRSVR